MPIFLLFAGLGEASERWAGTEPRNAFLRCGRLWLGVLREGGRLTEGMIGGDGSWMRSTKSSKLSSSLSAQGVSDLSESVNELSRFDESLSSNDGGGGGLKGSRTVGVVTGRCCVT